MTRSGEGGRVHVSPQPLDLVRRMAALPVLPGAPDCSEEDADNLHVEVCYDEVRQGPGIRREKDDDDHDDVEDGREDEVEDCNPKERTKAVGVRTYPVRQ